MIAFNCLMVCKWLKNDEWICQSWDGRQSIYSKSMDHFIQRLFTFKYYKIFACKWPTDILKIETVRDHGNTLDMMYDMNDENITYAWSKLFFHLHLIDIKCCSRINTVRFVKVFGCTKKWNFRFQLAMSSVQFL